MSQKSFGIIHKDAPLELLGHLFETLDLDFVEADHVGPDLIQELGNWPNRRAAVRRRPVVTRTCCRAVSAALPQQCAMRRWAGDGA